MPAYHYIALNQEQKELSGIIEAPDDQTARQKLNALGLSVVSLNVTEPPKTGGTADSGKNVFEFEAIDKNSKKVTGTITSENAVKAYARLFDEYQLNVLAIYISSLNEKDKEEARKLGIASLQKEYEKTYGAKKKKQHGKEEDELAAEQAARKELLDKVAFTMQHVQNFLKEYSADLKIEERDTIQSYINQLIRIKESTNLEHIRTTCEKMLEHLQKQELFIQEEQKMGASVKLKAETSQMLEELKQTGLKQEIDIVKMAAGWAEKPLLKPIANVILRLLKANNPEIQRLRGQIKTINGQMRFYIKILIFGKSNIMRLEAWQSIKTLREEKKRLKMQMHAINEKEAAAAEANRKPSYFWENAGSAIGWVLAFYLLAYIASYPFTIKDFGLKISLPKSFYFYDSSFLKGVTILLFLAYCSIEIRNYWLKRHWAGTLVLYPITIFGFLLIVINLM